eukprot:COSAG01_NODE_6054_length_3878_cov_4.373379_1_plen_324_part_00
MKVLRVFITEYDKPWSHSSACPNFFADLESSVGVYNDTILHAVDVLAEEARQRGIKLTVALHDRSAFYSHTEPYVTKYNVSRAAYGQPQALGRFYRSSAARADFKRRLGHALSHVSTMSGQPWSAMPEHFFSFEPQNEEQMHNSDPVASDWLCEMAGVIKAQLTKTLAIGSPSRGSILVTTGGGAAGEVAPSVYARCAAVDVLAIHDYTTPALLRLRVAQHEEAARRFGKRWIVQEYSCNNSALNSSDARDVEGCRGWVDAASTLATPQQFWGMEVLLGTVDLDQVVAPASRQALVSMGSQAWPEIHPLHGTEDYSIKIDTIH